MLDGVAALNLSRVHGLSGGGTHQQGSFLALEFHLQLIESLAVSFGTKYLEGQGGLVSIL